MKKKRWFEIFSVIVLIVIIYSFIMIRNLNATRYGNVDTIF
ncbi:hypothetical protein [Clostridium psychrophilum]|nr:hypothetical protein [Clostridium psychrophilum]